MGRIRITKYQELALDAFCILIAGLIAFSPIFIGLFFVKANDPIIPAWLLLKMMSPLPLTVPGAIVLFGALQSIIKRFFILNHEL